MHLLVTTEGWRFNFLWNKSLLKVHTKPSYILQIKTKSNTSFKGEIFDLSKKILFFDYFLCIPEVTTNRHKDALGDNAYHLSIYTASFICLPLFISEKMTDQCFKIRQLHLWTGSEFYKNISLFSRYLHNLQHILNPSQTLELWARFIALKNEKMKKFFSQ